MLITRECDYAVRVMRALAYAGIRSVGDICRCEHIPVKFAYKILKKLENRGLLVSHRGPQGGYELNKYLDDLTLFDVVAAIEDEPYINECLKPGFACPMNIGGVNCSVHSEFCRVQRFMTEMLQEKSLAEIFD